MAQLFTGIDILEINRFRSARYFWRIAEFVLTTKELEGLIKSSDQPQYLASRFAVKEAVVKALPEEVGLLDFEITKLDKKPFVKTLKKSLSRYSISVSLSHSETFTAACAVVILD